MYLIFFEIFPKVGIDEDLNRLEHFGAHLRERGTQDQHVPMIFHHLFEPNLGTPIKWMIYKRFFCSRFTSAIQIHYNLMVSVSLIFRKLP